MDLSQVKALIQQGESHNLEFKKSTTQLKPACETICAFLNTKGGTVLIGVKDDGQIIGQHLTDNTRQEIAREIKKIEPPSNEQINIDYVLFDDNKFVIVIDVIAGGHAPYTYDGRPYVRIESSTGLMSQHLYEQLLVRRGQLNHAWDTQLAKGYTINSLDHEDIRRTIKEGVDKHRIGIEVLNYDIDHILRSLELIKNDKLVNAAVVLYAKDVKPDYSQCMIRLARFRGIDKLGDFIDNQRVYGNAFRIISAALEFAMRHLPIASFFEPGNIQRIDQPAVPQLALREALVNAISHRDYTNHSATISLAIYDDRLELWNNGVLPPQLSFAALRKRHESYPRNKTIATIFYEQGWVEGWGTGTTRMIGYCQKNGTPEPEFEEYSGGFVVIFRFKEPMGGGGKISNIEKPALNKRQEKILEILTGGKALSANEIFDQLDDVASLRTVKADLAALKKLLLLEQIGKGRATVWKVRK
ncbi:MAG: putative DNA binding domain-containing protein [Gammaproteobacteria bacterium]|nr:putative DNA binding domain-containing protein [Gammaproteobacteria bacterium]